MSFSLSGSTITQSGTDTDLSGLSGLTGVTSVTNGGITAWDIGTNQLVVNGTLTIDPEENSLFQSNLNNNPAIDINGTLNVGVQTTINGVPRYSAGMAIYMMEDKEAWDDPDSGSLNVTSSGTLNWYGGVIDYRAAVGFQDGSSVNIYSQNAVAIARNASDGQRAQIRQRAPALNIEGLTLVGATLTMISNASLLKGIRAIHCTPGTFQHSNSTPSNTFLTTRDYDASGGSDLDYAVKSSNWFRAINTVQGSEVAFGEQGSDSYDGLLENRVEVEAEALDINRSTLTDWVLGIFDSDSGNRLSANQLGSNPDYTADRTYTFSDSSGIVTIDNDGGVLISIVYDNDSGSGTTPTYDYRSNSGDDADIFNIKVRKYGYFWQTVPTEFKGAGGVKPSFTFLVDPNVTQDSATASGHTGITVTDHGGTPVSWNGKNFGITVTGDLSVNSALTATDIEHYLHYNLSQNASFNGKATGLLWHNLAPVGKGETENGEYGTTTKGVRVVDENGDPFPGFTRMQADDGTYYVPPVQYSLTFSGLESNSEVRIYESGTQTELAGVENSGSSFTYSYQYTADFDVDYVIFALGYQPIRETGLTLTNVNTTIPISQVVDRVYENPT